MRAGRGFGRQAAAESAVATLDGLSVFTCRLDDRSELGDLTQTALELLDDLFGIGSSMLLMADDDLKSLFVVAHHGSALVQTASPVCPSAVASCSSS